MVTFFGLFRKEGFPTQYGENQTPAATDVLEAGFILAFVILSVCFYLVMPALHGKSQLFATIRVTVSLTIGAILMTSNFGQDWETAHIISRTPYKAGQGHEINASIGLRIGLRSVNITLVEINEDKNNEMNPLRGEIINYNEMFVWTWDQGRLGFGPSAGHLQQDFRKAQLRGLPLPILWVADYFTIDGEGLRFGRFYRTAGWYTHIAMWAALPCWLLANFLFFSVIRYGSLCTILTGVLQVLACVLWSTIRNPNPLIIPFEDDNILKTKYGINFWLTLTTGILCILIGIVTLFLDLRYPDSIALFFGIDPLSDYEEHHLTATELESVRGKDNYHTFDNIEMNAANSSDNANQETQTQCVLKRRTTLRTAQRSLFRHPTVSVTNEDDEPFYGNIVQSRIPPTVPE